MNFKNGLESWKCICLYCELVAYYAYWHDDRSLLMSNIDDDGDDDDDDDDVDDDNDNGDWKWLTKSHQSFRSINSKSISFVEIGKRKQI